MPPGFARTGPAIETQEDWQEEQWGEDEFATHARDARRGGFDAAVRFLALPNG